MSERSCAAFCCNGPTCLDCCMWYLSPASCLYILPQPGCGHTYCSSPLTDTPNLLCSGLRPRPCAGALKNRGMGGGDDALARDEHDDAADADRPELGEAGDADAGSTGSGVAMLAAEARAMTGLKPGGAARLLLLHGGDCGWLW